jgi:hypothetical protein
MKKPMMIDSYGYSPIILFVDTSSSICGSWTASEKCDDIEVKGEDSWFIYKCMYCQHEELMKNSCLATTTSDKRCRKNVGRFGYCNDHDADPRNLITSAMEVDMPWRVESLQEFSNKITAIAKLMLKRDILHRIRNMRDVNLGVLYEKVVRNQEDCYVYFLRCGNYVKIGSSVDPEARVEQLRKDNDRTLRPKGLRLNDSVYIGSIAASRSVERDLHSILNRYRVVGEWFEWTQVVEDTVTDVLADEISIKMLLERAIEDPEILDRIRAGDRDRDSQFLEKELEKTNAELRTILPNEEEDEESSAYANVYL